MCLFGFENAALLLLVILVLGLLAPELFRRLRMPYVTAILLTGAFLGPYGFDVIDSHVVIEFFGFLGSIFLLLMAGLEVKLESFQLFGRKVFVMAFINGIIPFVVGLGIMRFFGFDWISSLLVGVIFISSSVAIVSSSLNASGLMKSDLGKEILSATVVEDIFSLLLLAFLLQSVDPITTIPLPQYFFIVLASVFLLFKFLPYIVKFAFKHLRKFHKRAKDEHEDELHVVVILLIAVLLYFSWLGMHPIIAAFVVGLLLSQVIKSKSLLSKIHTLGYGLFVPVFFFIVGTKLDLGVFTKFQYTDFLMVSLIAGSVLSKLFSGFLAGRLVGFSKLNSWVFGVASTAQLTTTLAVTFVASGLSIITPTLVTAIILLTILTSIFSPILLNYLARQ